MSWGEKSKDLDKVVSDNSQDCHLIPLKQRVFHPYN